jgi:hypothetical protein
MLGETADQCVVCGSGTEKRSAVEKDFDFADDVDVMQRALYPDKANGYAVRNETVHPFSKMCFLCGLSILFLKQSHRSCSG